MEQEKTLFVQSLFEESATAKERLGTVRNLEDGRRFVYAKNGGVALAAGKLTQSSAPVADHTNKTVAVSGVVGDKQITINVVTTPLTADLYKDGFIYINDAAGEGFYYKIRGHKAASAAATCVIYLYDSLRKAVTAATSEYTLIKHPQEAVIVCPTTLTSAPAGIPPIDVTIGYYFWNQVKGFAVCLIDGTVVIGEELAASNGVAGAVEALVHATTFDTTVGVALVVNADTEYGAIHLDLSGY